MGGLRGAVPTIRIKFYRLGSLARYENMGKALHFTGGSLYLYGEIAPHSKQEAKRRGGRIMRVDLYTKVVLTVIAACLLFSVVKSVFSPREATARGAQPVYVEGGYITVDGTVDVSSSYKWPVYVRVVNPQ